MTAVVVGLAAAALAVRAAPAIGVGYYCVVHRNVDNPGRDFYGAAYKTDIVPPAVIKAGANTWRCMDGRVQVCAVGADGRACGKLDPGLSPAKPVRAYCGVNPGSDFVPMVVIGNSATTWRCTGAVPYPLETQKLDKRGFVVGRWRALP